MSNLSKLKNIAKPFVKNPKGGIKDADSLFNVPYSLSKKAQTGLGVAAVVGTGYAALNKIGNINNMGEITAGGLSDMTDSVKLSKNVK